MSICLESEEIWGESGYAFEPEWASDAEIDKTGDVSSESSDSDDEKASANWKAGRAKMPPTAWCKCGRCVTQKTDIECFCCRESELCLDLIDGSLKCLTEKAELASYVAHQPSLEMMYIDGMIRRFLKGPAPSQLSNRSGVLTYLYVHFAM